MEEKDLLIAEAITNALISNGVERVRALVRKPNPTFDGLCTECAVLIPPERIATGAQTCIDCQEILERHQAQYRR